MGEQTDDEYEKRVRALLTDDDAERRERLSEGLIDDPVETIHEMVIDPDEVSRSMRTVTYDEQGLHHFIDPRYRALYIGLRVGPVADDGTANMVLFQSWDKEVKRDPPAMKKTKTWYEEQTHVTWARIFVEADRDFAESEARSNSTDKQSESDFETDEELRDHVRSQMEYCEELDTDDYFELNTRLVGRYVDDGPYGDDLTPEWIREKLQPLDE